jgi:hypothetical protein
VDPLALALALIIWSRAVKGHLCLTRLDKIARYVERSKIAVGLLDGGTRCGCRAEVEGVGLQSVRLLCKALTLLANRWYNRLEKARGESR